MIAASAETTYETDRLRLEPLRAAHAAEMFELLSDSRLYHFIPREPPPTLASLVERFQRLERRASPDGEQAWLNWVLRSRTGGHYVGRVEVTLRRDHTALLAYEIGAAYWGHGFATEACERILRVLFQELSVSRVIAEVDTRNAASIRLLERLAFRRAEFRAGADFFKGAPSDEFTFVLEPSGSKEPGMELRVHKVCQTASGGSYVAIYDADVDLLPVDPQITVEIAGVDPADTDPADIEAARAAIRRGAEQVLLPRGQGAIVRVRRIVIHPVDFKPHRLEMFTADALARALAPGEPA